MNETTPAVLSLDRYGAASRCLLRLRENNGNPGLSDREFLARYTPLFPQWHEHPGELDLAGIRILARELGVGTEARLNRNYAQVLRAHRTGHVILVQTVCAPLQQPQSTIAHPHTMLLESITPHQFTLWCPFESGAADVLPPAEKAWWREWNAVAVVISPVPV